MSDEERIIDNEEKNEDKTLDLTLRPTNLKEFVGQTKIKENIMIFMTAAKQRGESMEHVLFYGPPGLGKTTLSHILAKEMGVNIRVTSGPAIERAGDLAAILTNLEDGDILFIDEIHRLNRLIEEVLYPAMEDYALDIVIGKGPSARTLRIDLPKFTLIGATTRYHLLSSPLRDRFGSTFRLDYYQPEDIKKIVERSAKILSIDLLGDSSRMIADRSRLTPRIANRLLKRVRDYVQVKGNGSVNPKITQEALDLMEVDHQGLDSLDRKILTSIIEKFKGGPVGINSIAASVQEEEGTIEEIYEPYLIQLGFLTRTSRGRVVTEAAYKHLGLEVPGELQSKLI
jgi:holliday junction DNA helicase RuvB